MRWAGEFPIKEPHVIDQPVRKAAVSESLPECRCAGTAARDRFMQVVTHNDRLGTSPINIENQTVGA